MFVKNSTDLCVISECNLVIFEKPEYSVVGLFELGAPFGESSRYNTSCHQEQKSDDDVDGAENGG